MKKNIVFIFLIFLISCAKEDPKLLLSKQDVMAYSIDEGWELFANVLVTGFNQIENEEDKYNSKISYTIDFITPEKDTLKEFDFGTIEEDSDEELMDLRIELQSEFNNDFSTGSYELIFFANDENSKYINKDTLHLVFEYSN
ncbi:MAG: hypothetical protein JEY94_09890 [Melioribacteraceae bacterium]|nr:hypothetical protein [Melioribacteraceae bacterium]